MWFIIKRGVYFLVRCGSVELMNFHFSLTCKCSWKRIGRAWVMFATRFQCPYECCWCIIGNWNEENHSVKSKFIFFLFTDFNLATEIYFIPSGACNYVFWIFFQIILQIVSQNTQFSLTERTVSGKHNTYEKIFLLYVSFFDWFNTQIGYFRSLIEILPTKLFVVISMLL